MSSGKSSNTTPPPSSSSTRDAISSQPPLLHALYFGLLRYNSCHLSPLPHLRRCRTVSASRVRAFPPLPQLPQPANFLSAHINVALILLVHLPQMRIPSPKKLPPASWSGLRPRTNLTSSALDPPSTHSKNPNVHAQPSKPTIALPQPLLRSPLPPQNPP